MLKRNFGTRDFYKRIMIIALPLMFQQMLNSFVNIIGNLMVGQISDSAVAAMAIVNSYYMIALMSIIGFTSISGVFITQYHGAENKEKIQESFRISLLISAMLAIPFIIFGLTYSKEIIVFYSNQTSGAVVTEGIRALKVITLSLIPMALATNTSNAMRSVYDTKTPLVASIVAIITNVTLNMSFLFGWFNLPHLGVLGVAISMFASRSMEMGILTYAMLKKDYPFKSPLRDLFKVTKDLVFRTIQKGFPLTINEIIWASAMSLLWKFYGTRGELVLTSFAIASTIYDIFFSLFGGIATAASIIIAHSLGANDLTKAKTQAKQLLSFGIAISFIFSAVIYSMKFVAPFLYQATSVEALNLAGKILQTMALFFPIFVSNFMIFFILRSGGAIKEALFMDAGFMGGIMIPVLGLATYFTNWNFLSLYILVQSVDLLKLLVAGIFLKQEKWVKNLTLSSNEI